MAATVDGAVGRPWRAPPATARERETTLSLRCSSSLLLTPHLASVAPRECPIEPLPDGRSPILDTVTGDPLMVYVSKFFHDTFPQRSLDDHVLQGYNISSDSKRATGEDITAQTSRPIVDSALWSPKFAVSHGEYMTTT